MGKIIKIRVEKDFDGKPHKSTAARSENLITGNPAAGDIAESINYIYHLGFNPAILEQNAAPPSTLPSITAPHLSRD